MINILIRTTLILIIGLVLQACGKQAPENSCNFVQNSEKQRVSWSTTSLPVKIYIHESVPAEYHNDLELAVKHWNDRSPVQLLQIVSFNAGGSAKPKRDGFNVVTWLEKWDSDSMSEQARTTINWSKNNIYEADIKVNAETFNYATLDDNLQGALVDFTSLMVHEFGHVLGLSHNDDIDSVMRPKLGFSQRRGYSVDVNNNIETDIKSVDVNSLACEYTVHDH